MELVVGDVDQPGAEETSPANCQHDTDVVRAQIVVIAGDIGDGHSFSDIELRVNRQTENIIIINDIKIKIFLSYTRKLMKNIRK